MAVIIPTAEQNRILDETESCVVIANPGSGKTFTVAEKIRRILPTLAHFRGVIAISFTNKASAELKRRALIGGFDPKSSFFGTIDRFFLVEIIYPFARHVFGRPSVEPQVTPFDELSLDEKAGRSRADISVNKFNPETAAWYGQLFQTGKAVLECNGGAAVWVLQNSIAARRYLKARYAWVFIDEYQDCDYWQDRVFVSLSKVLKAVAVGDLNQSIYGFANKDPKYLEALTSNGRFRVHALTANHRSHVSIVNYATRLLAEAFHPLPADGNRVHYRRVIGDEVDIGRWISDVLPTVTEHYSVTSLNQVGILAASKRTVRLISQGLTARGVSHRVREDTALDRDTSLWGALFRSLLGWLHSAEPSKYEVVDQYLDIVASRAAAKRVLTDLRELENALKRNDEDIGRKRDRFVAIAKRLIPSAENRGSVGSLVGVLGNVDELSSYAPVGENEVHLMTLHKSKGLEFDVVFHVDLYEHIIPKFRSDFRQSLNLHYVGITRARATCFLVSSTQRHQVNRDFVLDASPSPFLSRHGLDTLRDSKEVAPKQEKDVVWPTAASGAAHVSL